MTGPDLTTTDRGTTLGLEGPGREPTGRSHLGLSGTFTTQTTGQAPLGETLATPWGDPWAGGNMALEWIPGLGWTKVGPVEERILEDSDHRIQTAEEADRLNRKLASLPWGRSVDW